MVQNHKVISVEKAQDPKNVITVLSPYFPNSIGARELFKIFSRYNIDLFNEIKYKGNLFKLFVRQFIKKCLDRGFSRFERVKHDFSHG